MAKDDINHLNATLTKIETEIERLIQKRSLLRRQLNGLVSSTRKLPAEVLSEIFRLVACVPNLQEPQLYYVKLKDLLFIGMVCSQWRQVAWSTASLWTTCLSEMVREVGPMEEFEVEYSIPLTRLVLTNARNAPVSIRVNLAELPPELAYLLFAEHRAHIGALRITIPDEDVEGGWGLLCSSFEPPCVWPCLKELWLDAGDYLPLEGPVFRTSQALHYARREVDAVPWNIPSNQITVLRLRNIPIDQCLYLLRQCSNLTEYHCVDAAPASECYQPLVILPQSQRPASLPSIQIFRWKQPDQRWMEEWNLLLYTSIRLPGLRRLHWGNSCPEPSSSRGITQSDRILLEEFIPSLNHITALDWESRHTAPGHFSSVCGRVTFNSLQQLYISTRTSYILISWLEKLTLADGYDDPNQSNWFPNLRVFHANIWSLDFGEVRTFSATQRFLCSRRNKPRSQDMDDLDWYHTPCEEYWKTHTRLERFIVETTRVPLRIAENQLAVLRTLVSRGLIFELVLPSEGDQQRRTML